MKLRPKQIERLVSLAFKQLKDNNQITFKSSEEQALKRAAEIVAENYRAEAQLDHDVNKMMDDLERQHPGEFERYKMFPMLKKKMAKERGFVL